MISRFFYEKSFEFFSKLNFKTKNVKKNGSACDTSVLSAIKLKKEAFNVFIKTLRFLITKKRKRKKRSRSIIGFNLKNRFDVFWVNFKKNKKQNNKRFCKSF